MEQQSRRSETPTSILSSQQATPLQIQQHSALGPNPKRSGSTTNCAACDQAVHGPFVRALHKVYHTDCFRCKDCREVVAQKFFPIEEDGGLYPLCVRDYFARIGLICAKCDQALRSKYITACGKKFHVEHFSCYVCDKVFGATDWYYEHGGNAYCPYHYAIGFANKCVGCETSILRHFVEMNRNGMDECWHPECYMIHKFWKVRLASRNFSTPARTTPVSSSLSLMEITAKGGVEPMTNDSAPPANTTPGWDNEVTAEELKDRQIAMELKVSQIWLILSGFEESSAACISEMLRVLNEHKLLDVILVAERLVLHVETLFAAIDDLHAQFAMVGAKAMPHSREAKQLCKRLVNFFLMLSDVTPQSFLDMKALLLQVMQLAHYLKITIRIALTSAIKLDREQANPQAMTNALARLHLLALDGADPSLPKRGDHPTPPKPSDTWTGNESPEEMAWRSYDSLTRTPQGFTPSTQGLAYGYRSLAPEITGETTLRGPQDDNFSPNSGCPRCGESVEDDCVRLGMWNRWHSHCVECGNCGDNAANVNIQNSPGGLGPLADEGSHEGSTAHASEAPDKALHQRRPPPRVGDFFYDPPQKKYGPPDLIWCNLHRAATAVPGFETVSRLEQYVFLVHIGLRRLYLHFRNHHHIPNINSRHESHNVKRVKSVTLDRKLSSTARLPQRSTVIESPRPRMADENGHVVPMAKEPVAPLPMTPAGSDQGSQTLAVDVIRPSFARNNTSVRIVSEEQEVHGDSLRVQDSPGHDVLLSLTGQKRTREPDAITLNDIPLLAQAQQKRNRFDGQPLVADLKPLEAMVIRHFALLHLQKTGLGHLVEPEDFMDMLEMRRGQWWNFKLFKNNAKKDQKRKGIFGVPIEILVERTGSDSQQGISPKVLLRVPEFVEEITATMRQQDMAVEGIFRKNGNIRKLALTAEALDTNYTAVALSEENPVQLAALLKKFLREIPDPLLTFRLHRLWCAAASMPNPQDKIRCLHLLMMLLPKPNRDTIEVVFVFLRWVASFSGQNEDSGSKMDLTNLATVITPNILYGKGQQAAREESMIAITAVQSLLEKQDDFYRVPPELNYVLHEKVSKLFSRDTDLAPKEVFKLCQKYYIKRGLQQPHGQGGSQTNLNAISNPAMTQRPSYSGPAGGPQRPPDSRLSTVTAPQPPYRKDSWSDEKQAPSEESGTTLRAGQPGVGGTNSRPTSWVPGATTTSPGLPGPGTPTGLVSAAASANQTPNVNVYNAANPPTGLTMPMPMPMPTINGQPAPAVISPGSSYGHGHSMPMPSPSWRGPFQGPASTGSRQSSRGSAPPSPGVAADERPSFQMERGPSRDRA
ncbi:uncharacterized protein CcaverHIS019_0409350 [Cutaneotrichosporon cavernicola]|uniref:RhoGAP-domain-containing protein n=1 Tax=Cutaneotrichosporon cavernicola TaxID=279322 RepID=A0AA48QW81_9TREE|nr:uncharacterized protein CcaverHIS019_0409350 [Cutaneotrichosporon cavernicola]BEI92115.1 hypothetical protein CcaverHIS019_0409350 [Cutaneotrichosporon cavernicola]BEI99885.1 hypothetical protein CcaverHIS631_0409280 [Cutaneotrichosporon cavernicola]BEJ07660.1 hypothetical protein CcaverHIS641_0409290 [Cutaneotrichosporon cavernicola]